MNLKKQVVNFSILDALRGFAALYVCIAHARGLLWMGMGQYLKLHPYNTWKIYDYVVASLMSLTKLSGEFVIFFFVLSGFSIAHSLASKNDYLPFLKKRALRLYPTYLLGLLWASVVLIIAMVYSPQYFTGFLNNDNILFFRFQNSSNFFSFKQIINNLLYNPNTKSIIAPYWSLVYEVIFYLLAPLFILRLSWYVIISAILFVLGFFISSDSTLINYFTNYNFYFMVGIYSYHIIPTLQKYVKGISVPLLLTVSAVTLGCMIVIESISPDNIFSMLLSATLSVFLIANTLQKRIRINWLEKIGEFSYTLYATHFQTILLLFIVYDSTGVINTSNLINPIIWITAVPICVIVAYLFYLATEKKIKIYLNNLRSTRV